MGMKQKFQRYLGVSATDKLIMLKKHVALAGALLNGNYKKKLFADNRPSYMYSRSGKNVFFGYYDLQQYSEDGQKLLAHVVKKHADPAKDTAQIGWFDVQTKQWHPVAETKAWSWQQGARLRWHPTDQGSILYNDMEDGKYVTKACRIDDNHAKIVSRALYDVDSTFSHGLSLNFARLQRLCPGYGYSVLPDDTISEVAPQGDGVYSVNLKTGEETLLFSLADLAKDICDKGNHYINHLSISPSGERFMFFHIWRERLEPWKLRFYSANMDGSELKCLEKDLRTSHYCWLNDKEILTTSCDGKYIKYHAVTGEKQIIEERHLVRDGHPSMMNTGFLTDTYPQKKTSLQYVFRVGLDGRNYKEILQVFSDPRCFGEHRCDLHPRVHPEGKVTIDTTCRGNVRSILSFELSRDEL